MREKIILTVCFLILWLNFKPAVFAAGATTLRVESVTAPLNDNVAVNVRIDTGVNKVAGADIFIDFDKDKLEALSIDKGGFFSNPQILKSTIDNNTGKILYGVVSFDDEKQGAGVLVILNFRAKAAGAANISFGTGTSVAAKDEDEGLKSTVAGTVTVTASGTTPVPTATQTPSPTPTTVPPTPTSIPKFGDFNGDGQLDINDVVAQVGKWTQSTVTLAAPDLKYDMNNDGKLTLDDIVSVLTRWITSVVK